MNGITADTPLKLNVRSETKAWIWYVGELMPIALLYLALAFYRIDAQSFWVDEAWSVNSMFPSGSAWADMYRLSPVYFVLLGLWAGIFGITEFTVRAFSALLGLGIVCMTYVVGYRLMNRRTAVLGAILMATSPYLIWYAQEARYYTLMIMISLIMTYAFHRAINTGGKWWFTYTVASLFALFSFVTVVFLLAAHGLYVLFSPVYRAVLRKWAVCQVVVLVVFAAWFVAHSGPKLAAVLTKQPAVSSHKATRSAEILPAIDLAGIIPYTFYAFSVGFSLGPSLRELHIARSVESLMLHAPLLITVALLFTSMFLLGLKKLREQRHWGMFIMLWLIVPILGTYIVATTTTFHEYNTRYVGMSLPAYMLILATAIASVSRPATRLAVLVAVIMVNGFSLTNYYFNPEYAREDARSTVGYLESMARPGDVIIVNGNPAAVLYYYKGDVPIVSVPRQARKNRSVVSDRVLATNNKFHRAWLVEIRKWETDPHGTVKGRIETLGVHETHKSFAGVQIHSYRLAR